ncbi:hypothetical protein D3C71_1108330 [compost metagenome]
MPESFKSDLLRHVFREGQPPPSKAAVAPLKIWTVQVLIPYGLGRAAVRSEFPNSDSTITLNI